MRVGLRIFCSAIFLASTLPARVEAQTNPPTDKVAAAPAAPVTRESLAGLYDGGQMEVAAQLLLKPDGQFEYGLAYGALDEEAKGTWEFKDGAVFLTTEPAVVPPRFVVESDTPDARGGLWIKVSNGPVIRGAAQRVYLIYDKGQPEDRVEVGEDGRVPFPGKRRPTAIIPMIPVYPILNKPIPLTGTGGHLIVLRFEPNDIGKADFRGQRLSIEDGNLVMLRPDLELRLRFRKQKQPSSSE